MWSSSFQRKNQTIKKDEDPRGTRYEVIGPATDMRDIGIICRIKSTGKLLLITTYELEEENE